MEERIDKVQAESVSCKKSLLGIEFCKKDLIDKGLEHCDLVTNINWGPLYLYSHQIWNAAKLFLTAIEKFEDLLKIGKPSGKVRS